MVNTLLAIKKNMTSVYDSKGRRVGATIVALQPNAVTQVKTVETDGYTSVQLGIQAKKSVKKPQQGHLKKAGVAENTRFLRETRTDSVDDVTLGQEIKAQDVFHTGDLVKVQGVSKGKGFQGTVRRHGFHGGPKTHGQSDRHRAPGSIGQGTTPGRVYKGKKMSGHMGVDTVSIKSLEVIKIDRVNNEMIIKGGVPGPIGGLLKIIYQGQVKGYVPQEEPEEIELSNETQELSEASLQVSTEAENTPDTQVTEQTPAEEPIQAESSTEETIVEETAAAESAETDPVEEVAQTEEVPVVEVETENEEKA
jgi:large subunit ribosomal protein L3